MGDHQLGGGVDGRRPRRGGRVGFDIYSSLQSSRTTGNKGFATLKASGRHGLSTVNLLTGDLSHAGWLHYSVEDLAVDLDR